MKGVYNDSWVTYVFALAFRILSNALGGLICHLFLLLQR
jgi:hypothetical protein